MADTMIFDEAGTDLRKCCAERDALTRRVEELVEEAKHAQECWEALRDDSEALEKRVQELEDALLESINGRHFDVVTDILERRRAGRVKP